MHELAIVLVAFVEERDFFRHHRLEFLRELFRLEVKNDEPILGEFEMGHILNIRKLVSVGWAGRRSVVIPLLPVVEVPLECFADDLVAVF